MSLLLFIIIVVLVTIFLIYYDSKTEYTKIPINKHTRENGEFYFSVEFFIWQRKKVDTAKQILTQNSLITIENYTYEITNFGGVFPKANGLFFERELRYFGHPLIVEKTNQSPQVIINQYSNGMISIDLSTNKYLNEIFKIENYLSQDNTINVDDKDALEQFLGKIRNHKTFNEEEVRSIYNIFIKYEPLASFSVNLFNAISSFLKL